MMKRDYVLYSTALLYSIKSEHYLPIKLTQARYIFALLFYRTHNIRIKVLDSKR